MTEETFSKKLEEPLTFEKNAFVFISDTNQVYVPAKVVESFTQGKPDGKIFRLDNGAGMINMGIEILSEEESALVLPMDEASVRAHSNMISLKTLNNAAILHNIRMRFLGDQIYTYVGDILISLNPNKFLPLYTPDVLDRYKLHGSRDEPPHVYAVADNTWRAISMAGSDDTVRDQAVIVQGDSGAGKTEVTKLFLQYVAEMSGGVRTLKDIARGQEAPIQEQILRANPVLEAFGNARTQQNDNSSRFGKFTEVVFSRSGEILGGTITQYMLEKSRVVEQFSGERNFHIFYQLLAGANKDAKLKAAHRLGEPDEFYYLNQGLWEAGPGAKQQQLQEEFIASSNKKETGKKPAKRVRKSRINDEGDWEDMCASLDVFNFSTSERDSLFQCVAAILHLGNVHFETVGEVIRVSNPDQLNFVAKELGCSPDALTLAFTTRIVTMGKQKEKVSSSRSIESAESARDALAKDVYAKLFKWLLERLNFTLLGDSPSTQRRVSIKLDHGDASTAPAAASSTVTSKFLGLFARSKQPQQHAKKSREITIGILDIFGFEQLEFNSFNQLCINYCNEKLNYFFVHRIFELELAEYLKEGISDVVPLLEFSSDSELVLKLFESRPAGIFALLEDEVKVAGGSDDSFVLKLFQFNSAKRDILSRATTTNSQNFAGSFVIQHFASSVEYDSMGMVQTNKASIPKDVLKAAKASNLTFMKQLFQDTPVGDVVTFVPPAPLIDMGRERAPSSNIQEEAGPEGPGSRRSFTGDFMAAVSSTPVMQRKKAVLDRPESVRRKSFLPQLFSRETNETKSSFVSSSNIEEEEEVKSKDTLTIQFKNQLNDLLGILSQCDPHFIRCIKPNAEMRAGKFNSHLVMDQLKVASMLPLAQIRQQGFPVRYTFVEFYNRFRALDPNRSSIEKCLTGQALVTALKLNVENYQLGKNKIFLKSQQARALDVQRDGARTRMAIQLARIVRGHLSRVKFHLYRETLNDLVTAMLTRNQAKLDQALRDSAELPYHGRHLDTVKDAKILQTRLMEEQRIVLSLTTALKKRDLTALLAGLAAGREIKLTNEVMKDGQAMVEKLSAQKEVHQKLVEAVQSNDVKLLAAAMANATKLDAIQDEAFLQCVALKSRSTELAQILNDLDRAMRSRQIDQLNILLSRSVILGIPSMTVDLPYVKARTIRQSIRIEEGACRLLDFAVERRDEQDLKIALAKAEALKTIKPERLAEAKALKLVLEKESLAFKQLAQATLKNDALLIDQALQYAESIGLENEAIIGEAMRNKERLKQRDQIGFTLSKALESVNAEHGKSLKLDAKVNILSQAVFEAVRGGVSTGRVFNDVSSSLRALGRKGEAGMQVMEAIQTGDHDALEASMKNWRNQSLPEETLSVARQVLGELKQEQEISKLLSEAMALGDVPSIVKLLSQIHEDFPQFPKRNHYVYEKAKGTHAALRAASLAVKYRDLTLLENCIQLGVRAGAQHVGLVARISELRDVLIKEREFASKLPLDNVPVLREMFKSMPKDMVEDAYDEVLDARAEIDRAEKLDTCTQLINEATVEQDLAKVNQALYLAIELGIPMKQVDRAFGLRAKLESQQEIVGELLVEMDTMRIRMHSRNGLVTSDLAHTLEVLHKAKGRSCTNVKEYAQCMAMSEKMRRQLVIQDELKAALARKEFTQLKLSMDHAQEAEVEVDLAVQVRALVRELDLKRRQVQRNAVVEREVSTSQELATNNKQNAGLLQNAKQEYEAKLTKSLGVRYKWERFPDIRTDEDFSKGSSKKQRTIDSKLVSQTVPIPKSLLVMDKTLSKVAIKLNKDILGYCGDRAMSFPPSLARDLLQKSVENPLLGNETLVQLCRHITKNPKADSAGRAWQLMCMCVSCFPPTVDFELYLLNFLQSNINVPGLVSNYARFALRRLEGILTTGASGMIPTLEEIAAYKERPPILATIELVDGTVLTQSLPVTPDLDAERVVDLCIHFLGLKDVARAKQLFAIFVVDETERKKELALEEKKQQQALMDASRKPVVASVETPNDLPRTAKFLQKSDFLGSVIVQMTRLKHDFTFVFKRKLHLADTVDAKNKVEDDAMFKKLIYLQAQESFVNGELGIHDLDQIVNLISVAVAADNEPFPESIERLLDEADVISYVPRPYRKAKTDRDWAKVVLMQGGAQFSSDPSEYLQDKFVDLLKRQILYGAIFFHALRASESPDVVMLPNHLILGVNSFGVHLEDADNRRKGVIRTIRFDQVKRWGGSARYFSFTVLKDGEDKASYELALNTPQASELSLVMTEYVNSLVGSGMLNGFSRMSKGRSVKVKSFKVIKQ